MNLLIRWMFFLVLVSANVALAQSVGDPAQTASSHPDWTKLNIFGLNGVVVVRVLGEAYGSLRNGGGLVGLWRTLIYGQSVPKAIAKDYEKELEPHPDEKK
jgi:hypothetical protein